MNKLYSLFAVAGLALLTFVAYAKADPLVDQVFNPSVQLGEFCSGEIIYSKRDQKSGKVNTVVLTAKHCVLDKKDNEVVPINKHKYDKRLRHISIDSYDAVVLGKSYKSDLALLELRDKETLFDDVALVASDDTQLAFGQDVEVVGYPLGRSMTYTPGKLGYVEDGVFPDVSDSTQFFRATPDIAPGSSGSSMFTLVDGKYQIIGIVTGGASMFSWFNFFTPIEEINEYLDAAKPTYLTKEDKKVFEEEQKAKKALEDDEVEVKASNGHN